jgi:hypothetical protein
MLKLEGVEKQISMPRSTIDSLIQLARPLVGTPTPDQEDMNLHSQRDRTWCAN